MTTPVQSAYALTDATSPDVLAFSGAATAGNTVITVISWFGGTGSTMPVPVDVNGTYSTAINTGLNSISCGISIFYVPNCAAGTHSTSIRTNVTPPDFNFYCSAAMYEVPGLLTASPFDKTNNATTVNGGAGQTSQATGTTGTLSQASEFVIVIMGFDDNPGVANEGILVPSGYTVDPNIPSSFQNTSSNIGLQVGWLDVSATTALNPSFTWTSQAGLTSAYAGIATFAKSTAVAQVPFPPMSLGGYYPQMAQ